MSALWIGMSFPSFLVAYACTGSAGQEARVARPPRLFPAHLEISAKLCGPPAVHREFRTTDFMTLLDLEQIPERVHTSFF